MFFLVKLSGTPQDWNKEYNGVKFSFDMSLASEGFLVGPEYIIPFSKDVMQTVSTTMQYLHDRFMSKIKEEL